MNKITLLILLIILSNTVTYSAGRNIIETRIGGSFNGKYKSVESDGIEILGEGSKVGYEIVLEGLKEVYPNTYVGLGIGYQKHGQAKDIKGKSSELYTSVPAYITIKYQLNSYETIKPYLKTNFGLSFNRTENGLRDLEEKVNGYGFYGAIGGGIEIEQFIVDLSYQINTATTDGSSEKNIDHSRVTLGLGYRFDF